MDFLLDSISQRLPFPMAPSSLLVAWEHCSIVLILQLVFHIKQLRQVKPVFHGACFGAVSAPTLFIPRRVRLYPARIKLGVHSRDSACLRPD